MGLPPADNVVFGMSLYAEGAMEMVEKRLRVDPAFRRRWAGGVFRPIPYHLGLWNQKKQDGGQVIGFPNEGALISP
jgi:hypothetical protein